MRLTIVAEVGTSRYAVNREGDWFVSWCYRRWLPAFRYNPVPLGLAESVRDQIVVDHGEFECVYVLPAAAAGVVPPVPPHKTGEA